MTLVTYLVAAWVVSVLAASLACYWLGWRDRGEDDRDRMSMAYESGWRACERAGKRGSEDD